MICKRETGAYNRGYAQGYKDAKAEQPERIKGHWVDDCTFMGIQCSVCGKSLQDYIHATEYAELMEVPNFCPNCGADMRGEQDE